MKLDSIVRAYLQKHAKRAVDELDWFRHQATVLDAVFLAATATDRKHKRYRHQCRIPKRALQLAKKALTQDAAALQSAADFDALYETVKRCVSSIKGIGSLYIYDTSLRIGARLQKLPERVYLHAGTRRGAKALHLDHRTESLAVSELPVALRRLAPHLLL